MEDLVSDHEPVDLGTPDALWDHGRVLALDIGSEHTGVAVSDEHRITARRVTVLPRTSWKELLRKIEQLCRDFDARALVVGLPLNMDGTSGAAAENARRIARNLHLSLRLPVYLQDERLSSRTAAEELMLEGVAAHDIDHAIHSQSAAVILRDFLTVPKAEWVHAASS